MASTTSLIAIVLVAIVAVGGVSAFILIDDDGDDPTPVTGRLQVYGNVNNDDHIDSKDLSAFDEMIESWDKETYPYADANRNGILDDGDKAIVQDLIDRKPMTVTYINGLGEVAQCDIPINRIGIAGTMVHPVINSLGASNLAFGKTGKSTSLDPVLDAPTYNLPMIGPKAYELDKEEVSKYNMDAIFTLYSSTYDDVEDALVGTGIDCVRINPESSDLSLNTYLLVGFLLDRTERADAIVGFYDHYNKVIADKVSKITDKKTTLTMYSYSMCATDYYMTKNTVAAGTINLSDFSKAVDGVNTRPLNVDNGAWAAVDKYQADYIIQYSGWSVRWDDSMSVKEEFEYYGKYFEKMDAYPANYFVVNKTMPDIARTAFVAGYIYDDEIGLDFAYDLYQELVETFYPWIEDYDVKNDSMCIITYEMAQADA